MSQRGELFGIWLREEGPLQRDNETHEGRHVFGADLMDGGMRELLSTLFAFSLLSTACSHRSLVLPRL